jgi:tryptophanyl-tRNA synthetase
MKEEMKITPWKVSGEINYERLIKDFGVSKLDKNILDRIKKHTKDLHFMLRRKIFFAHRDMNWLLDEYEKGNKFFLYTGRAPSGPIHIGHLMPWIFTKWLQEKFKVDLWFQFPDEEKFLFNKKMSLEDTNRYLNENILDIVALGFNPKKTNFLIDTQHAGIMYKHACRVAKKITFSTIKASFGFKDDMNIGSIFYTSMQAVPAFLPSVLKGKNIPCLIPLAVDQDPHFRVARDVYPKLNYYKPSIIHSMFLPSLTGPQGKMSSSESNMAILTTDSPSEVETKIKKYAFSGGQHTIAEHRKKGANPEVDVSFQYLRMFFEPDDKKLNDIYEDYKSGALLTSELKEILIEKINAFLKLHQERRRKITQKDVEKFIFKI